MDYNVILDTVIGFCTDFAFKILASLIILFVGFKLIKFVIKKLKNSKLFKRIDASLVSFLVSFLKVGLYTLLFLTAASILGIPMVSFVTILASAGVAIGLALQGSLSNLAGGVVLLLFRPYKVGDYIKTSEGEGTVSEITVFYTIVKTADNTTITIPNGKLTNSAITNYSISDTRRVELVFNASKDSDIEKVKELMILVAKNHDLVLNNPEPFARMTANKGATIEYTLRVWCKKENFSTVSLDLQEQMKKVFDHNGM